MLNIISLLLLSLSPLSDPLFLHLLLLLLIGVMDFDDLPRLHALLLGNHFLDFLLGGGYDCLIILNAFDLFQ